MRSQPKILAAAAAIASLSLAQAAPVTIDFENYVGTQVIATATSGGFTFAPVSGLLAISDNGSNCGPTCAANGTRTLAMPTGSNFESSPFATAPLVMSEVGGGSFYLLGFDYAEFFQSPTANATSLQVVGNIFGGGTITQTLSVDGLNDGPGGANDFQASALAAGWATSLLTSVEFSGFAGTVNNRAFQLDNVRVDTSNQVPEPGSVALVALALLGALGASRRRDGGLEPVQSLH